jgi:hypothetical protein
VFPRGARGFAKTAAPIESNNPQMTRMDADENNRLSVSPSQLDALLEYVENQEEHHRRRTFQDEYREFLLKHGVDYDERYVWD